MKAEFSVTVAAGLVGVVPETLRSWDRKGLLKPARNARGARVYTVSEINRAREIKEQQRQQRERRVREARLAWQEARRA